MDRTGVLLLAGRLLIAAMFLVSGYGALADLSGATGYFASLGMPMPEFVALGTGVFEFAAALLLIVGYQTRLVALALAAFSIAASTIGHLGQGDDAALAFLHWQAFLKDIAVAGGLLAYAAFGAGPLSADARLTPSSRR